MNWAATSSKAMTTTTTVTDNATKPSSAPAKKPSLLPKPKIKVIVPPALLQQQLLLQEQQEAVPATPSSRIPVAKRAAATTASSPTAVGAVVPVETQQQTQAAVANSRTLINAEKRASWRAARLRSLEQGAVEAQSVIQNMNKIAADLLTTDTAPAASTTEPPKKIVFPKIAIKSCEGPVIIREREKVLNEKIIRRTEEVACPLTGLPQLRTVEYIEKIIETEVETCREKIISLELQDPEKCDTSLTLSSTDALLEDEEPPEFVTETESTAKENHTNHYEIDANKIEAEDDSEAEEEDEEEDDDDDDEEEDDEDDDDDDDEEDAASIVTVHANNDKLFLRSEGPSSLELDLNDFDNVMYGPSSVESSISTKVSIKATPISLRQTLAKEVVLPANITSSQSIVEVVNPLIAGEGHVKHIVVSRSEACEYPSFDGDDIVDTNYNLHSVALESTEGFVSEDDELPTSTQVLRSETFVLPTTMSTRTVAPKKELSLNAKMKNVLEELLENKRVKLNLQKSLEEDEQDECNAEAYGSDDDDDEVDFGLSEEFNNRLSGRTSDKNGNQDLLDELIRESNRNTLLNLADKLKDDNEDDLDDEETEEEEDDDDDDDDIEEEESEDSEDSDSDDDDDEENAVHLTFVDGCQVIENLNTQTPMKLQKSQTYTTMKEAATMCANEEEPNASNDPIIAADTVLKCEETTDTVGRLQQEQQKLEEISKQLRQSVENLLADDDDDTEEQNTAIVSPVATVVEVKTQLKTSNQPQNIQLKHVDSGEALFNRLLAAGGDLKQVFDEQTGESVTTTTTTDTNGGTTFVTTTTTITNVVTSGIPRAIIRDAGSSNVQQSTRVTETTSVNNKNAKQQPAGSKQKRKGGKSGKK